jgi:excisionase family DNA binding protein
MNPEEVAKYLRIHKMTVYRLCKERKLPFCKVGGSIRFPKYKIDEMFGFMLEDK